MNTRYIDFHSHFYDIASRHYVDEVLAELDLTEQQKAAILGGNTARLLAKDITTSH